VAFLARSTRAEVGRSSALAERAGQAACTGGQPAFARFTSAPGPACHCCQPERGHPRLGCVGSGSTEPAPPEPLCFVVRTLQLHFLFLQSF